MTKSIVVIGAGGFGREVLDVLEAWNAAHPTETFTIAGVVDDAPSELNVVRLAQRGYQVLGPVSALEHISPAPAVVVAVGNPAAKARISQYCAELNLVTPTLIHPTAVLGSELSLGHGVVVCAGVIISTNVVLADHVHLCSGAVIGHDTTVSARSSINPGAVVSGEVVIGERTLVGAGAVILQGLTVGDDVTVGAAACVTKDVPEGVVVVGVPARITTSS